MIRDGAGSHDIETAKERAFNELSTDLITDYGDGIPYVREHYLAEIRRGARRSLEEILMMGRRFIVMKGMESRGNWLKCLEDVNFGEDTAQRMMMAARRLKDLSNTAAPRYLIESAGNQAKLFEMLALSDEQLVELAELGETAGIKSDDIGQMSSRELRAAIREARDDMSAKDERAGAREREIERLNKELRKARLDASKATPDEAGAKLREKTGLTVLQLRADIFATGDDVDSLRERFSALREHAIQHDINHDAYMGGIISELLMDLRGLRDDFGLPVLNDGAHQEQLRREAGL